nr:MAG TPA: hypothetical protein [Caudoviricetes sp.]
MQLSCNLASQPCANADFSGVFKLHASCTQVARKLHASCN